MSQLNLHHREGEFELTFNFYANRQYERKIGETAPQFVRSVMMSQVKTHHLLAMIEVCLIKHHPKMKGAKLEKLVETFIDTGHGSFSDIVAPLIEAITESGMFKIKRADADDDEDEADPDPEDADDVASVLGGETDAGEGVEKEAVPDKDDPTT